MKNILFLLFLCINFLDAQDRSHEKKHTVLVLKNWQPYYILGTNGKPTGFAIEVFEHVAKDIGLQYEYKILDTWYDISKTYESGLPVIVPDIGITKKRETFLRFSLPTNTFQISLFKRVGSNHINTIDDLKGKVVGVVHKNIGQRILNNYPQINKKVYPNHFEAINALLSGGIDALAYPRPLMYTTLNNFNIHNKINLFDKPLLEIKRAFGVSIVNEDLLIPINKSLDKFFKTQEYNDIYEKYFSDPYKIEFTKSEIVIYALITAVLCISIISLFLRNRAMITKKELQKQLIEKTKELNISLDLYNAAFSATEDGIWDWDLLNSTVYYSPRWKSMLGYTAHEIKNNFSQWEKLIHPDDLEPITKEVSKLVNGEISSLNNEVRMLCKSGKYKWILSRSKSIITNKNGKPSRIVGTHIDITNQKKQEKINNEYINIIDKNVLTSSTDLSGKIISASDAFCRLSGYEKTELIGKTHKKVNHSDMDKSIFKEMWDTLNMNLIWTGEIKNKKKNGDFYWVEATISPTFDEDGKKNGYTSIRQDITDKKLLETISITDGLTNIYNRRYFDEVFPKAVNAAKRENNIECFALIDIDYFKQYNDTYGHQLGDTTLIKVAQTLQNSLNRADDYCFRLGGEEFGVLYRSDSKQKAIKFANQILKNIEDLQIEHKHNSASDYVTISLGLICENANNLKDLELVYQQADQLLYKAKKSGRNQIKYS